jgi:hypothetical protein
MQFAWKWEGGISVDRWSNNLQLTACLPRRFGFLKQKEKKKKKGIGNKEEVNSRLRHYESY